jgi:hypothetical protein
VNRKEPQQGPDPAMLAAVLAVAALVVASVTFLTPDTDVWQHLTVGRAIWLTHSIPHTHQWSWPTFGVREVLPSWLFRALLWPVYAAAGGAVSTTSIDMSRTYLDWAKRNLSINGIPGEHRFVQEDCLAWLAAEERIVTTSSFSTHRRFRTPSAWTTSSTQRDHVDPIRATLKRLAPGGLLLFSTNFKFKLDGAALTDSNRDITMTVPSISSDAKVHACFEIRGRD